jgi:hypothetical protein
MSTYILAKLFIVIGAIQLQLQVEEKTTIDIE